MVPPVVRKSCAARALAQPSSNCFLADLLPVFSFKKNRGMDGLVVFCVFFLVVFFLMALWYLFFKIGFEAQLRFCSSFYIYIYRALFGGFIRFNGRDVEGVSGVSVCFGDVFVFSNKLLVVSRGRFGAPAVLRLFLRPFQFFFWFGGVGVFGGCDGYFRLCLAVCYTFLGDFALFYSLLRTWLRLFFGVILELCFMGCKVYCLNVICSNTFEAVYYL